MQLPYSLSRVNNASEQVNRCGERVKTFRRAVAASANGDIDISLKNSSLCLHSSAARSKDCKASVAAIFKTSSVGDWELHFAY